jgi:hypothetical protein
MPADPVRTLEARVRAIVSSMRSADDRVILFDVAGILAGLAQARNAGM